MFRTSKVKLGRSYKQEALLLSVLESCRQLYNAALQQRREAYSRQKVSVSLYEQYGDLTDLRADDPEFKLLPSEMTRLTSLRRLDLAYVSFYRRSKAGKNPGFPRFKGKGRFDTLISGLGGWKIEGKKLIIKAGPTPIVLTMRNKIHRDGEIKGLRIVKRQNRWWADFRIDVGPAPAVKAPRNEVGIDVGLRTFAKMSDGKDIDHPHFLKKVLPQVKEAQRDLSSKKKGSNNRKKSKQVLSRISAKVANKRKDFIFQTVAALAKEYDGFKVEKLNIVGMLASTRPAPEGMTEKNTRSMRRNIMDASWGMFIAQLKNKAEEAGFPVVLVNPKGTSQHCSDCGTLVRKALNIRIHECPVCGLVMDRDENSARNILQVENDLGCRSVPKDTGTEVTCQDENHTRW
jgi:putative transposase